VHETIQNIRPGPLDNEKTTLGCLITSKAVKKITELVSDAESKGAKAVLGGKRDDIDPETFHPSTILKDMTSDMQGESDRAVRTGGDRVQIRQRTRGDQSGQ
jgi:succinate-semialdehyde dehydrogenase/glutarate-semialdehyde dehydrogenase